MYLWRSVKQCSGVKDLYSVRYTITIVIRCKVIRTVKVTDANFALQFWRTHAEKSTVALAARLLENEDVGTCIVVDACTVYMLVYKNLMIKINTLREGWREERE